MLVVLGLAACGGGSSGTGGSSGAGSSSGSGAPGGGEGGSTSAGSGEVAPSSPEAAWAKEVKGVMSYFENHVAAQILPSIQDTYSHVALEPLYRTYGHDLGTLANKLAATKAPAACTALHDRIADIAKRVAQLTTELGEQPKLSEKQYSLLLGHKGEKIRTSSIALTELTARPSCR